VMGRRNSYRKGQIPSFLTGQQKQRKTQIVRLESTSTWIFGSTKSIHLEGLFTIKGTLLKLSKPARTNVEQMLKGYQIAYWLLFKYPYQLCVLYLGLVKLSWTH